MNPNNTSSSSPEKVRIDKWLWAARFFKTRSLAKQAIDGGKIHIAGQRVKASKEIEIGMSITIRQGWDEREVIVVALSEQRRGAPEAALLYAETEQSIEKRALKAEQRRALGAGQAGTPTKPTGKQRRQIHRFKRDFDL